MSPIPFTTPSTISTAQLVTASLMNTEWVENIKFLANPPACRVYHNTTQSIPHALSTQAVSFNSERYDTDNMHSTSSNTSRITINTAGLYVVGFQGVFAAAADYTYSEALLSLNGATFIGLGTKTYGPTHSSPALTAHTIYKFAAGDYIQAAVGQQNAASAARNLLNGANYSPEFWATWIGHG